MTALALRVTDLARPRWPSTGESFRTSTWSRVKESAPSAPASTNEADSQRVTDATWVVPVMERLDHLLQLQDGWDGPGTLGIDVDVVQKTIEILARIAAKKTRPPSISPGQDGGLQLAWYVREFELEIDIPRSGDLTASLYEHDSGQESELELTSPQLYAAIERLAAG
jgi:hypothetical protein